MNMLEEMKSALGGNGGTDAFLDPRRVRFCADDSGKLKMTTAGQSPHRRVELRRAFPHSAPDLHVSVFDPAGSGHLVGIIKDLTELDAESYRLASEALNERQSIAAVVSIRRLTARHGLLYFDAETSMGPRRFAVGGAHDCVDDLPDNVRIVTDLVGNRYLIPDRERLDRKSRLLVERFL